MEQTVINIFKDESAFIQMLLINMFVKLRYMFAQEVAKVIVYYLIAALLKG